MRVAVLVFPGATLAEVMPAIALVRDAAQISYVGPTLDPVRMSEGFEVIPTETFETGSSFGLVLAPGGDVEVVLADPRLRDFLRTIRDEGGTVAAICNGAFLLARAGLLSGKKATHTAVERYAPSPQFDELLEAARASFSDTHYVDEDVVVDGRIITAKPWAAIDFAKVSAQVSGVLSQESAAARARYQKGVRDATPILPYERWAVFLEPNPEVHLDPATSRRLIEDHVGYLRSLERTGLLELAGPWAKGGGLVILRARDESHAHELALSDPFVQQRARLMTVRRWLLSCEDNNHML